MTITELCNAIVDEASKPYTTIGMSIRLYRNYNNQWVCAANLGFEISALPTVTIEQGLELLLTEVKAQVRADLLELYGTDDVEELMQDDYYRITHTPRKSR